MKRTRLSILALNLFLAASYFLLLTGCGFHPRGSISSVPPQLHVLYLAVDKPDTPLNQGIRNLLQSLNIQLVSQPEQAPLILRENYEFRHSTPKITSTNQTVAYNYVLRVTAMITNPQGVVIVPQHLILLSRSLVINTNQIYTPNSASLVKEELQRDAINLFYYWLTSANTRIALATGGKQLTVAPPSPAVLVAPPATNEHPQAAITPPQPAASPAPPINTTLGPTPAAPAPIPENPALPSQPTLGTASRATMPATASSPVSSSLNQDFDTYTLPGTNNSAASSQPQLSTQTAKKPITHKKKRKKHGTATTEAKTTKSTSSPESSAANEATDHTSSASCNSQTNNDSDTTADNIPADNTSCPSSPFATPTSGTSCQ